MKKNVAVICCCNNEAIINDMLLSSLDIQEDISIERFIIRQAFESASAAYNYAIDHTSSEYLVFVHQDIAFTDSHFLVKLVEEIEKDKLGVYGLCGSVYANGKTMTFSNVWHGLWNRNVGKSITDRVIVNGLDEIMVAFHRDLTKLIRFDEVVLNGWHLFVEDICIQATLLGKKVYVLPLKSQHKNYLEMPNYMLKYAILPKDYFHFLIRLRNKYKDRISILVCPCFTIRTSFFSFWGTLLRSYRYHRRKEKYRRLSL